MIFQPTGLVGAYLVEIEEIVDERGFFARSWCEREFERHGLVHNLAQCSISFNTERGTLRGMHYQASPREEAKVVRCTSGAIYDVIVDLRPNSPSFSKWVAIELTAQNRRMIYVPPGVAHGFQSLVDNTEVFYQVSEFYSPECSRSVRWDDPFFDIRWPDVEHRTISARDRNLPDFSL